LVIHDLFLEKIINLRGVKQILLDPHNFHSSPIPSQTKRRHETDLRYIKEAGAVVKRINDIRRRPEYAATVPPVVANQPEIRLCPYALCVR
jgi:hypothetical protein